MENESKTAESGTVLKIEDHAELAKKYLTEKALKAVSKVSNSTHVAEDGKFYQAIYLGVRVRTNEVEKAACKVAGIINELAEDDLIHSILGTPLNVIELAHVALEAPTAAAVCFVLVPSDQKQAIEDRFKEFAMREGESPKMMGSLKPDLEEGEFLTDIYISHLLTMKLGVQVEDLLQQEIAQYLAVLPKGTVVRSVEKRSVVSLAIPYEVKFYNPLMKDVKLVKIRYNRCFSSVAPGRVEEYSLLTGISYFDSDGKALYASSFPV